MVGGNSGRKGKENERTDNGSHEELRFCGETMMEVWQEMAALYVEMIHVYEGCMVGFLLSVVSNICRMEPT